MKALLPDNEVPRLAALRHYDVLDTAPELGFDDLTLLTRRGTQGCQVLHEHIHPSCPPFPHVVHVSDVEFT